MSISSTASGLGDIGACDGGSKRIEVADDQVDRRDALAGQFRKVLGRPTREDAAVDSRVQAS